MSLSFSSVGVFGAGAWGTALAIALSRSGHRVILSCRDADRAAAMQAGRVNSQSLPAVTLPDAITCVAGPQALLTTDAVVMAMPAQHLRAACLALHAAGWSGKPVIVTCKGIERRTYRLMSEIVAETLPGSPAYILSGPSFAHEVAAGLPAALTLAGEVNASDCARALLPEAGSPLRLYTTDDIIGVQIGGAVKNVLAIACGIVHGRGLGENARAAVITRGLAEIVRLGTALGARPETLMGLAGLGDVALSCASPSSRNMALGIRLARGETTDDAADPGRGVTEGVATASAVLGLARRHGIDMPVASAVDAVLQGDATIDVMIAALLARPLRAEGF